MTDTEYTTWLELYKGSRRQALQEEWINRLQLDHWTIRIHDQLRPEEMSVADTDGCVNYETSTKTARVEILDPKYYGDRVRGYDYERTLVHELLHIKLAMIDDSGNDVQDRVLHQLVDELAGALVEARRAEV